MIDLSALSPEELQLLVAYARRCYRSEAWPFSHDLREIREALTKLEPPRPTAPPKPTRYEPSMLAARKARRR